MLQWRRRHVEPRLLLVQRYPVAAPHVAPHIVWVSRQVREELILAGLGPLEPIPERLARPVFFLSTESRQYFRNFLSIPGSDKI
jgi:hypothetical protein